MAWFWLRRCKGKSAEWLSGKAFFQDKSGAPEGKENLYPPPSLLLGMLSCEVSGALAVILQP